MTPAAGWDHAVGMATIERARRGWEASEPQYVIPGFWDAMDVLEQVDAGTTEECPGGVGLLEPALTADSPVGSAGSQPHERSTP